jgi:hypothetical protein
MIVPAFLAAFPGAGGRAGHVETLAGDICVE